MNTLRDNQKLIDRMYNMAINKTMLAVRQILFNPTKEQEDRHWYKKCNGLHNTRECKQL